MLFCYSVKSSLVIGFAVGENFLHLLRRVLVPFFLPLVAVLIQGGVWCVVGRCLLCWADIFRMSLFHREGCVSGLGVFAPGVRCMAGVRRAGVALCGWG